MIHLFPKLKNRMLLMSACCIALAGAYIAMGGRNPVMPVLIVVVGIAATVVLHLLTAFNMHSQLIARLYDQLNVESFLRGYEPLTRLNLKNPNLSLMVKLHMSNAYCAEGRFDEAEALLTGITVARDKNPENELLSRFAVLNNLCYCAQLQGDIPKAQARLDELLSLKKQLESLQAGKPEKRRMVFSTALSEQVMAFLSTGKADIEELRKLAQHNPQQLHKITISLWIARAYLAENNRREAEALLNRIVKLAPDLYPGKAAAEILSALPGRSEENA